MENEEIIIRTYARYRGYLLSNDWNERPYLSCLAHGPNGVADWHDNDTGIVHARTVLFTSTREYHHGLGLSRFVISGTYGDTTIEVTTIPV